MNSFAKKDKGRLSNRIFINDRQTQNESIFQPVDNLSEQLDSLTGSFVKLEKDELENYSATHEAFIQYHQQFRQYVRDYLDSIEDKVDLFVRGMVAVPLVWALCSISFNLWGGLA